MEEGRVSGQEPKTTNYVVYYRVSTARQGQSGLGLDAQQRDVTAFLRNRDVIGCSYTEIETGTRNDRAQLIAALRECKLRRATLLVGRLDRLSRNALFLFTLLEGNVPLAFADMPNADRTWVQMKAVWAEHEGRLISERTKAALASARARGVRLGGPVTYPLGDAERAKAAAARQAQAQTRAELVMPVISELQHSGAMSLRKLASGLNARGVTAPRGGSWTPMTVARVLARAG